MNMLTIVESIEFAYLFRIQSEDNQRRAKRRNVG